MGQFALLWLIVLGLFAYTASVEFPPPAEENQKCQILYKKLFTTDDLTTAEVKYYNYHQCPSRPNVRKLYEESKR